MEGQAADGTWNALSKTSLHAWHVPAETEAVRWVFHADTFNAGSTGVTEDVLYINPVNCFLYHPDHQDWGYSIALDDVPAECAVAKLHWIQHIEAGLQTRSQSASDQAQSEGTARQNQGKITRHR